MQLENFAQKHPELHDKTPYELFKLYFDADITELTGTENVRYSRQKNSIVFKLGDKVLDISAGILY